MDTTEKRYLMLEPKIEIFGPPDTIPRPALILFHGCGGNRPHIYLYAKEAAKMGVRAFVVDSFGPRGWNRLFAMTMVCSGLVLSGDQRAGDVLAALWGIQKRPDVDPSRIILSGWSHGGWGIMDLMTHKLTRKGEVGLGDPGPEILNDLAGNFVVYSYLGTPALSVTKNWQHKVKTLAVVAGKDHLTSAPKAEKIFNRLRADGVPVKVVTLDATHAFEEESFGNPVMRYDEAATQTSLQAMRDFLTETVGP